MIRRRHSYTIKQKLHILEEKDREGMKFVKQKYGTNKETIWRWSQRREKYKEVSNKRRTKHIFSEPQKGRHLNVEEHVVQWIRKRRERGASVSIAAVREEASLCALQTTDAPSQESSFSNMWVYGLMKRNNFSYRARTTTAAQKVPEDALSKAKKFWKFMTEKRETIISTTVGPRPLYPLNVIGNADETALFYEYPSNKTLEATGAKSVPVLSLGAEKNKCTVLLSVLADGAKLPPFVIFPLKTSRVLPVPGPGVKVVCTYQASGVCDTRTYLEWLDRVWIPNVSRRGGNGLF